MVIGSNATVLSPRASPPARDKPADGPGSERAGVSGGGSTSETDLDYAQAGRACGGQPRWTWEQMGAQDKYLNLSLDQSVEVDEEEEPMGSDSGRGGHTEKRSDAGDAHAPSVSG